MPLPHIHKAPKILLSKSARNTWPKPKIYVCQIWRLRYALSFVLALSHSHHSSHRLVSLHSLLLSRSLFCLPCNFVCFFLLSLSYPMFLSNQSRINLPFALANIPTLMLHAICFTFRCFSSKHQKLTLLFDAQTKSISFRMLPLFAPGLCVCGRE